MTYKSIAIVVAHPDDEVLGCGGTIAALTRQGHEVHVLILADGESSRSDQPVSEIAMHIAERRMAAERAGSILGCASLEIQDFPDNRMDSVPLLDIVQCVERFVAKFSPEAMFTHHAGDVNVDHRLTHDAVLAACRPQPGHSVKELLFFEVPSSTEWRPSGSGLPFVPNWFVDISDMLGIKLAALEAYQSELRPFPHPRSVEAVESLAKWRGATIGVNAAEAFVLARKII